MKKWLLVEDEPDLYEMLVNIYEHFNVEAVAHASGEDALAWLETIPTIPQDTNQLPNFALIDIRLPGRVNGVDVAATIHAHPAFGQLPIILMTAYRLSPYQERSVLSRSGARRLLYKPLPSLSELELLFTEWM